MDLAQLIPVLLKTSVAMIVLSIGLDTTLREATDLFRRPQQLARALISMNIWMPAFAVALVLTFDLHPAVKVALVALAMSPVPPLLPRKALKAGGKESYVISLMLAAALFSIVLVPLTLRIVESLFHVPVGMTPTAIARIMVTTVLAPLMVGAATHSVAPRFAKRLARPVALLATILLVICVLPVIVIAWPAMIALIGNGTLVALAAFVVAGLIGGHLLGGPTDEDRTVLALTTATRHPGLALAIAQTNFPQEKSTLAAIMLYLLVGAIVSIPYLNWRKRHPSIRPRPSRIHPGPTMARP